MPYIYNAQGDAYPLEEEAVASYFSEEIATTIASVKAKQTEPCLTFALWTDAHYGSVDTVTFPNTVKNFKAVAKQIRYDGILCLGDMTDGDKSKTVTAERLMNIMNLQRLCKVPVYFTAGNHDDNAYGSTSNYYTLPEMFTNYYSLCDNTVMHDLDNSATNFYKDFDQFKIRLISLNACNSDTGSAPHYKYSGTTTTWFTSVMGSVPEGYMVILISHLSPYSSHNWNETVPSNPSAVKTAITSFIEGGGDFVMFIGHGHVDFEFTSPYLEIATHCNKRNTETEDFITVSGDDHKMPSGARGWKRTAGTATEDCWDTVVIKPGSRTISMIRFGAGEDREYTY